MRRKLELTDSEISIIVKGLYTLSQKNMIVDDSLNDMLDDLLDKLYNENMPC